MRHNCSLSRIQRFFRFIFIWCSITITSSQDYVTIFDGYTTRDPVILKFCGGGESIPATVSSGPELLVEFTTSPFGTFLTSPSSIHNLNGFQLEVSELELLSSTVLLSIALYSPSAPHLLDTAQNKRTSTKYTDRDIVFMPLPHPSNGILRLKLIILYLSHNALQLWNTLLWRYICMCLENFVLVFAGLWHFVRDCYNASVWCKTDLFDFSHFCFSFGLQVEVTFVDLQSSSYVKSKKPCEFWLRGNGHGVLENPKHSLAPNTTCLYHLQVCIINRSYPFMPE